MKRSVMLAICTSILSIGCFTPALAQELSSEGKFSITWTSVNPAPSKSVSVGDRDIVVTSFIMAAVNDAGSGLLHNMPGRCNFMIQIDKAAKTYESHGFCNYTDKSGDQVFEEVMTDTPPTLGSAAVVKGKWLGGTGKFEGLSGEFEIHTNPILASESLVQGAGKKIGTYHITKSPSAQKRSHP
jgi:hypothetical protein